VKPGMSPAHRTAIGVIIAGMVLLGLLPLADPENTRLERTTPTTTASTRTSHPMNDPADETAVRKLAERYLAAVNTHDDATVAQLNCAKAAPGLLQMVAGGRPVTMGGLERAPVRDRYYVGLTIDGTPAAPMIIERRDGVWCVRD
jgi:hypothetical protein